jgi:hypothetical protein
MNETQIVIFELLGAHLLLFFICFFLIISAKGSSLGKKSLQLVFTFVIPFIGPMIGIYIHLSDRMKAPPHDPNPTEFKDNFPHGTNWRQ